MGERELVRVTERGLYCERGDFYIDPWAAVPRAVITHAHADHAAAGCGSYLASPGTADLLRVRIGKQCPVESVAFGSAVSMDDVRVSLHPAGHVLGSAQVLIEAKGAPSWCVSGDYKTDGDSTCEAFEPVRCDVFVTESTFGLPIFRWDDDARVIASIDAWRARNAEAGRTSVLLCYSLGKAQRVLASLDAEIGPIGVHGAIPKITEVYQQHGVQFPEHEHATAENANRFKGVGTIVAPPSAAGTPWIRKFAGAGGAMRTGMASGWMALRGRRRWSAVDTGFVLSDHADWQQLLQTIEATGASRVGVTHGYASQLARYLSDERGLDSFVVPTRFRGEGDDGAEQSDDAERVA